MHLRFIQLACVASLSFLLIHSAVAEPSPQPSPPVTWPPPTPTAPPVYPPSGVNAEEAIPVIITYGEGPETRTAITQGLMLPVGVPKEKSVTVTLLLPSGYAGQRLGLGLYDGGRVGAATLPGQDIITFGDPGVPLPVVSGDGSVQFNFEAGALLGLYRLAVGIGPNRYLLQFYATRPRPLPPLPNPNPI
jgi:hypothetical protein